MKTSTKNTIITAAVALTTGVLGLIGGQKLDINQTININEGGKIIKVNSDDYLNLMNENSELHIQNNDLQKQNEIVTEEKEDLQKQNKELIKKVSKLENNLKQFADNDNDLSSETKTNNKENSNYLLDLVQPYEVPYYYTEYNGKIFDMGGDSYTHGFTCMGFGGTDGNVIFFNLHGEYSKLSFVAGVVKRAANSEDCTITIYADGIAADTIIINPDNLPSKYEVNIDNCKQLKISVFDGYPSVSFSGTYGFGEVKILK